MVTVPLPVLPEPQKGALRQVLRKLPVRYMAAAIGVDALVMLLYQSLEFLFLHVFTTVHSV